MKNIQLEVSDNIYQKVIDFLSLLPKAGDDSEFDNWDEIKSSFIMKYQLKLDKLGTTI